MQAFRQNWHFWSHSYPTSKHDKVSGLCGSAGWPAYHQSTVHASALLYDIDKDGSREITLATFNGEVLFFRYVCWYCFSDCITVSMAFGQLNIFWKGRLWDPIKTLPPSPPPQAHLQENPISYKSRVQDSAGPWSKWPKPKIQTKKHLWITKSWWILLKNSSVHLEHVWYITVSYFQGGIEITLIPVIGGVKLIGVHDAG
jgi:hypothetical protein